MAFGGFEYFKFFEGLVFTWDLLPVPQELRQNPVNKPDLVGPENESESVLYSQRTFRDRFCLMDESSDGLVLAGSTLYGTAESGVTNGYGGVFALNTSGMGFKSLHTFLLTEGYETRAGLTLSGDTLYGASQYGGTHGNGTVFSVATNGTGCACTAKGNPRAYRVLQLFDSRS